MKFIPVGAIFLFFFLFLNPIFGQSPTQTIRGTVLDQESQVPLIGATVEVLGLGEAMGETTDIDGQWKIEGVPVGRRTLQVSYLGYEPALLSNIEVGSGKEVVLNIMLTESIEELEEVVIVAETDKRAPLNEMAALSARSFSVEETSRYAASLQDPARMALNYAGVSSAGDDLSNEIVIRGNSPSYVQWRLEGIEIPSPNHFSSKGSSGGGVSMLSSSMLANGDFYTGAFPAEIGNALAGAFDLNFRNGNNELREHSIQIGAIGLEASSEGPLGKNGGSYLVNYRYSILKIVEEVANLDFGDANPNYQDLSFKVNLPTKKAGVFSLFGLWGKSIAQDMAVEDVSQWDAWDDVFSFSEGIDYGLVGLNYRLLFKNQKSYLKTVILGSIDDYTYNDIFLDRQNSLDEVISEEEKLTDRNVRISSTFNHKGNAKNSYRIGGILSFLNYRFLNQGRDLDLLNNWNVDYDPLDILIDDEGNSTMTQAFAQWKHRASNSITFNTGLHFTHLALTGSSAFEPRASVKWKVNSNNSLAFSAGLHSQAEHLIIYTLRRQDVNGPFQPNVNLELTKAAHFVLGYDVNLSPKTRIKTELYYQRLYDVPIDPDFVGGSIVNTQDVYDVLYNSDRLTNGGKGRNIGIDVTLERFFDKGLYYLMTGSLFDSNIEEPNGEIYDTRFNSNYNLTLLGGKEWSIGKSGQNTFGVNGKLLFNGGNRYTEFDFATQEPTVGGLFKLQTDPYFRADLSARWKWNRPSVTHIVAIEIQNVSNRQNVFQLIPDFNAGNYRTLFQNGLIPNVYYRVQL